MSQEQLLTSLLCWTAEPTSSIQSFAEAPVVRGYPGEVLNERAGMVSSPVSGVVQPCECHGMIGHGSEEQAPVQEEAQESWRPALLQYSDLGWGTMPCLWNEAPWTCRQCKRTVPQGGDCPGTLVRPECTTGVWPITNTTSSLCCPGTQPCLSIRACLGSCACTTACADSGACSGAQLADRS